MKLRAKDGYLAKLPGIASVLFITRQEVSCILLRAGVESLEQNSRYGDVERAVGCHCFSIERWR